VQYVVLMRNNIALTWFSYMVACLLLVASSCLQ